MPKRALRMCSSPGCPVVVETGKCPRHAAQAAAREAQRRLTLDAQRGSSTERGYDAAWRRARRDFLTANPACVGYGERQGMCGARATEADHVVSVREAPDLRLHWSNLRPYCKHCHSARTATEQSFGRAGGVPTHTSAHTRTPKDGGS